MQFKKINRSRALSRKHLAEIIIIAERNIEIAQVLGA